MTAPIIPTNMDAYHAARIDGTGPDPWGHVVDAPSLPTGLPPMRPIGSRTAARRYRRQVAATFHAQPQSSVATGLTVVMYLLAFVCLVGLITIWVATGMGALK